MQGRKIGEVAGAAQRVGRLADQAGGGSMITTKSLASFDDDGEEEVLHRLNVILKVRHYCRQSLRLPGFGSVLSLECPFAQAEHTPGWSRLEVCACWLLTLGGYGTATIRQDWDRKLLFSCIPGPGVRGRPNES